VGTIIDGSEAVSYGIIDEVGGLSDAIAALRAMAKKEGASEEARES
jgi:ClpP class serine protease